MWKSTANDGAARAAIRSNSAEQRLRNKRRASPELLAICKAFDCDLPRARRILAAARN